MSDPGGGGWNRNSADPGGGGYKTIMDPGGGGVCLSMNI